MPKIPTFKAQGSITQLVGTTNAPQMGLDQTLATALAPATEAVVDFKIKEKNAQNQAEALKLENDFITDQIKISETINTDKVMSTNKDIANEYFKNQNNILINKYKSLATNNNVAIKFENYALAETQKTIFRTDTQISKNILTNLFTGYDKQKELLLITASTDESGMAKSTLKDDLEKLTIDTFQSQITYPELQKMLASIPNEIDLMDGLKDVSQSPSKTFELLKDKNYLSSLTYVQREDLKEKAKTILRPQIRTEFKNYVTARAEGKEPPRFNVEYINEIFTETEAQKIMVAKELADNSANNIKFFHTLKNDDIDINLKAMIEENNATLSSDLAKESNNFLTQSAENIKLNRQDNPVKYILDTNPDIENEAINVSNMEAAFAAPNQYDTSAMEEAQLNITERIIEEQINLGIKNVKVMTNEQSQSFVASYNEAAQLSDGDKLNNMVNGLLDSYGDNAGIAIQQLRENGLPFGALVSAGLKNSVLAEIALSFDTKEEKKEIETFLKISKINKGEMQEEIKDGIADFINIVRKNTPNDSTDSLTKTNEIEEFLTFVAAQKMNGNPDMSESDAIQFAVDSWNNNFVLTDTYYIGVQQGDKKLNLNETNRIQDTTDLLKTYYLDELDVVAFQSNSEDDPVVLSNKMRSQMSINGEWRNTPDGEGVIFGIVLDNGFAPVINNKGEEIIFKFDDTSGLVPGTDIVIDFDVGFNEPESTPATMLIDTFEKANQLARDEGITYEEALKKIRKPDIPNIEFDDGKKNSKISVDDQSSILKTIGDAIFTPVAASEIKQYKESKNVDFNFIEDREGFEIIGKVPDAENSKSGITIASGFDLGARKLSDLNGLPKEIINKLKPFLNLKGNEAVSKAKELKITKEEGRIINQFAKKQAITRIRKLWKKTTGESFDLLTTEQATVVASVAFQYGNLETATPNFWKYVTSNEWQKAYNELMDFGDRYTTRRKEEAKLLLKYLKTIK
jgi:hypothetical protein